METCRTLTLSLQTASQAEGHAVLLHMSKTTARKAMSLFQQPGHAKVEKNAAHRLKISLRLMQILFCTLLKNEKS